jgi:hypothetical protein
MPTKKQTARHAPTDQRPVCTQCGGRNVETTAWIETREDGTYIVVNSEGPITDETGNWCHDCDAHTDLEYPRLTPADDARRAAAATARARGPELLDALRWALDQIENDLDPEHQAAIGAARELVARCS